jgi:hypothetical protein
VYSYTHIALELALKKNNYLLAIRKSRSAAAFEEHINASYTADGQQSQELLPPAAAVVCQLLA